MKKRKMVIGLLVCVLSICLLAGCSFSAHVVQDKEFSYENMHITLTDQFTQEEVPNMSTGFSSVQATVLVGYAAGQSGLREYTAYLHKNLSAMDAIEMLTEMPEITDRGGYFRYTATEENGTVNDYSTYTYETADGLWSIQFVCRADDYEHLSEKLTKWEESVRFEEPDA